jgi:hypothetical protein
MPEMSLWPVNESSETCELGVPEICVMSSGVISTGFLHGASLLRGIIHAAHASPFVEMSLVVAQF